MASKKHPIIDPIGLIVHRMVPATVSELLFDDTIGGTSAGPVEVAVGLDR